MSFDSLRSSLCLFSAVIIAGVGCSTNPLRGNIEKSRDGKTYLAVIDDNGGKCGSILLDGQPWRHALGERALVSSGKHKIACGGKDSGLTFEIPEGFIFNFNYWGP